MNETDEDEVLFELVFGFSVGFFVGAVVGTEVNNSVGFLVGVGLFVVHAVRVKRKAKTNNKTISFFINTSIPFSVTKL